MTPLSTPLAYTFNPLDRLAERRDDEAFVQALRDDRTTRFVVVGRDRPVLTASPDSLIPFHGPEAAAFGRMHEEILLGRNGAGAVFAFALDDAAIAIEDVPRADGLVDTRHQFIPGRPNLVLRDLRALTLDAGLSDADIGLLGQAKSMVHWHRTHRFCGTCGGPTTSACAGWRRECGACGAHLFPRTDPVVIMLTVHGDTCLLGRSPRFPPGMYSALAGFLEPGETIEDAVRRETHEEAGIRVGEVHYQQSQPWPFPGSLMIGCVAQALTRDIVFDRGELDDCRWFSRDDVLQMLSRTHPEGATAPQPVAIAHRLMSDWAHRELPRRG